MCDKVMKYFSKHVMFASVVHVIGGIGIGIILARPIALEHPVRWGLALLGIAVIGHIYPLMQKK